MNAVQILERLVGFETVFDRPNRDLIEYVADWFRRSGVEPVLLPGAGEGLLNLWASIGPRGDGGVCLSGHTDVVPARGQDWTTDPFRLTRRGDRLFGRGSADMKGFCAAALARVPDMVAAPLTAPIHFSLTFAEEDGCRGAAELMPRIGSELPLPEVAIVGEPTELRVVSGHKGMRRLRTRVTGKEAHSSRPDIGVSAVMAAGRLIARIAEMADQEKAEADAGSPFWPQYTTLHVGQVEGGIAPTIMARRCEFIWEVRVLPDRRAGDMVRSLEAWSRETVLPGMREIDAGAGIETRTDFDIPGLRIEPASRAERLLRQLTGDEELRCVGYATEAGQFQEMGVDTILFGPGSIEQAHQPDEFITLDQLGAFDRFLGDLIDHLVGR